MAVVVLAVRVGSVLRVQRAMNTTELKLLQVACRGKVSTEKTERKGKEQRFTKDTEPSHENARDSRLSCSDILHGTAISKNLMRM